MVNPKQSNLIAIGDIHCQNVLLEKLLRTLQSKHIHQDTTVIFMGDYINRAKTEAQCQGTLDILLEYEEKSKNQITFLKGNHEDNFLGMLKGLPDRIQETQEWEFNIYRKYISFFEKMKSFVETDDYFFAHAGGVSQEGRIVRTDQTEIDRFALYWSYQFPDENYGKCIVRGHKIVKPDQIFGSYRINTDLGAYKWGKLCAVLLPERIPIIVEA